MQINCDIRKLAVPSIIIHFFRPHKSHFIQKGISCTKIPQFRNISRYTIKKCWSLEPKSLAGHFLFAWPFVLWFAKKKKNKKNTN